jgi:CBS domain-containing protein
MPKPSRNGDMEPEEVPARPRSVAPAPGGLAGVRVEAVMSRRLLRCPPEATVREVASLMARESIHCVVVEDLMAEEGGVRGWGMISDLDLATVAPGDVDRLTAAEIAATEPVMTRLGDSLERVARLMSDHQVTHVLVTGGEPPTPRGVVSTLDLARALAGLEAERKPGS